MLIIESVLILYNFLILITFFKKEKILFSVFFGNCCPLCDIERMDKEFLSKNLYIQLNNDFGLISAFCGFLLINSIPIDHVDTGLPKDLLKEIQLYNCLSNSKI